MEHRKRKAHFTNEKEEVPSKKRKTQTNTPTKSTTNNPGNNRKKAPTKSSNINYKTNIGRQRRRRIHQ